MKVETREGFSSSGGLGRIQRETVIHHACLWAGYVSAEKSCSVCSVCSFFAERECKHTVFFCCRNQVMRKKLILFFKRRNHARKQRVSVVFYYVPCQCMHVFECMLSSAPPSGKVTEVTKKLQYLWEKIKNEITTNLQVHFHTILCLLADCAS